MIPEEPELTERAAVWRSNEDDENFKTFMVRTENIEVRYVAADNSDTATTPMTIEKGMVTFTRDRFHFSFNLLAMTEPELLAVKDILDKAFEDSLEKVKVLDDFARREYDNTGHVFARLYRRLPVVFEKGGEESRDSSRLRERLEASPRDDRGKLLPRRPGGRNQRAPRKHAK